MSILMSKEEIALTISQTRDRNNVTHDAHYDRVLDRMCSYVEDNIVDFMQCYDQEIDDKGVVHQRDRSYY